MVVGEQRLFEIVLVKTGYTIILHVHISKSTIHTVKIPESNRQACHCTPKNMFIIVGIPFEPLSVALLC